MENPFKLTEEEQKMVEVKWRKPVRKKKSPKEERSEEERVGLHVRHTKASKHKQKASADLLQFLSDEEEKEPRKGEEVGERRSRGESLGFLVESTRYCF